jgi:lysophospholipase L1-like esterase
VKWYLDSGELQRQVAEFRPDLLIVALGANDAGNVTEGPYKQYLAQFVDQARAGGVKKIIWLGPSKSEGPQAHRMAARNDIAAWQSQALPPLGVVWHDSLSMTVDLPTRDGVHYRHAEYTVWAARAADIILDEVAVV